MPVPDDFLNLEISTSGQAFCILFVIINLSLRLFLLGWPKPLFEHIHLRSNCFLHIDKFGGEKRYLRTGDLSILACKARRIIGIMKLPFILPLKNVKHEK